MPERYQHPGAHARVEQMQRAWKAEREALATVRRFNASLSTGGYAWAWPKIAAALTAKHPWVVHAIQRLQSAWSYATFVVRDVTDMDCFELSAWRNTLAN
jgi:hypothetical protein